MRENGFGPPSEPSQIISSVKTGHLINKNLCIQLFILRINFGSKLCPSNFLNLIRLLKPHFDELNRDPFFITVQQPLRQW